MTVITISREFGSDGDLIGQEVAESLGYSLVTRELIEQVIGQYGMSYVDKAYQQKHNILNRYNDTYKMLIDVLGKTIHAFASRDDTIILGRGGCAVLGSYANVLNVCIKAPFEKRVNNTLKSGKAATDTDAEKLVRDQDMARKSFFSTFYAINIDEYKPFDLVIDTVRIAPQSAAKMIVLAAQAINERELNRLETTRGVEVDDIMKKTMEEAIAESSRRAEEMARQSELDKAAK